MKFLVDMPLSPALARWLSDAGHDAVHTSALGMERATDAEIIDRAKQDARIIVSADLDYPRLLALTRATEPSLILFRGGNWSDEEVISRVERLLRSLSEADFDRSILVIEHDRVRRRRLPI